MNQNINSTLASAYLVHIDDNKLEIYLNLARLYEAEFSGLTGKLPDETGFFHPDTMPCSPYIGYLFYEQRIPIGFCIISSAAVVNDVAEFYIIPSRRRKNHGYTMAAAVFNLYPGAWQVRQIAGADAAKSFWRRVISQYTSDNYMEEIVDDKDWGIVTRQRFFTYSNEPRLRETLRHSTVNDSFRIFSENTESLY